MKLLTVSLAGRHKINNFISHDMKIDAIKALRKDCGCGLREAKDAIEHLMGQRTVDNTVAVIRQCFRIKSFVLDCGDDGGEITVDMEELKLKFLMTLPEIGVDACGELLKLVQFIEGWQGK